MGETRAKMTTVYEAVSHQQPVMGTVLELRLHAPDRAVAEAAEAFVLSHVARLERQLTCFDPNSEFSRWRAGEVETPSAVLAGLLDHAAGWHRRSQGGFNPAAGVLSRRWVAAATEGVVPSREEMRDLAAAIAAPRYIVEGGVVHRLGDLADLNLNAIAKGYIVDRIAAAAFERFDLESVFVNGGGDLVHRGGGAVRVGIENPFRPFDNEPAIAHVRIRNAAVATSGASRRWFQVGERRFNQILDPWTGWPVTDVVSMSVASPDALTADVVATVLSVLPVPDALTFADGLAVDTDDPVEIGCMAVASTGAIETNDRWRSIEVPVAPGLKE